MVPVASCRPKFSPRERSMVTLLEPSGVTGIYPGLLAALNPSFPYTHNIRTGHWPGGAMFPLPSHITGDINITSSSKLDIEASTVKTDVGLYCAMYPVVVRGTQNDSSIM